MSSPPPPLPGARTPGQRPPRNWLQRNLKWALPLFVLLIVGGWSLTSWMGLRQMAAPLERSEPYREALAYPRLQAELPGRHAPVDLRDERDRDCAILPGCR